MGQTMDTTTAPRRTRERLLSEGMRLFAEKGYRATTVGEIEAAAGLVPRRGTLYKHFGSKAQLLAAAVESHGGELHAMGTVAEFLPVGDRRSDLMLMGRWLLAELDREREICLVLEKSGDEFRAVREQFFNEVIEVGFQTTADLMRRFAKAQGSFEDADVESLASVIVGAIVNHRRNEWTFGRRPFELSDDRLLAAVVNVAMAAFQPALDGSPS